MTGPMTAPQTSHGKTWSFGPYILTAEGHLQLGPTPIHLPPLQRRLLLALVQQKGQVLSRESLLLEVWGHNQVSEVSISRTVHGLRRALADGPLGSGVVRTIYGGGYRLEVPVHEGTREAPPTGGQRMGGPPFPSAQTLSAFVEGLVCVRQRDPSLLGRAESHFRRCEEMAPGFTPALVKLAATKLAQYRWGLVAAEALEPSLENLLQQAEATGHMAAEVIGLRVEALSLLHWQPELAEARFASWLPGLLPEGDSLHGWVRHLLATGRAAQALPLLEPHLSGENPDGWLLAATAFWFQGHHGQAIAALRELLSIDRLVAPSLLLALVLAESGRTREALETLETAAMAGGRLPSQQAVVALVLGLCGQTSQAAARLRSGLAQQKQQLPMTTVWGIAALAAGEEETASDLLDKAMGLRCGLAPFVQRFPTLDRYGQSPALSRFQAGMAKRFRCTF